MTPPLSPDLTAKLCRCNYWVNGLALFYVLAGYLFALVCIFSTAWPVNLLGTLLLVHALMLAAYFIHEFIHGTVFPNPDINAIAGNLMLFLTGSCYSRFRDLGRNHLDHHKDRADFSAFSIPDFLNSLPKPILYLVVALEWLYFPALNFILRWFGALSPFFSQSRQDERWKNICLLTIRAGLFVSLGWYSLRALLLYFFAYICFINILRFVDSFQHTYTVFQPGQKMPRYSLEHEETNTYSNLVSCRWSWLNLLLLNFGYHNAHHRVIHCPWYLLSQLDAELNPPDYRQRIPLSHLISNYHRFRVYRLFNGQGKVMDTDKGLNLEHFVGGIGVSFLILREPLDWLKMPALSNTVS
ncbi:MAG: fatty acid desaturase [Thermosynechococcaceae cyanobacterium]